MHTFVVVDQSDHPWQADGHQQYAQGDGNQAPDDDEAHPENAGQSVTVGQVPVVNHDYAGQAAIPERDERDKQHPDVDGRSPVDRSCQKEDLLIISSSVSISISIIIISSSSR